MRAALRLAERGLGNVWPNPAVGCIIVKDGRVVGRGWTQPDGRPHAETVAIQRAGNNASSATAYVTLEPCSHHGATPPCATALIKAGVSRVVVAIGDPDPRVSGQGISMLRDADIQVDMGCFESEATHLNAGFLQRVIDGRPLVAVKTATTLDGYIATNTGASKWITADHARLVGHQLRAQYDAMLVGIGTVVADNPMLNCRLPGFNGRQATRVVLDTRLRISLDSQLVRTAGVQPTWVVTTIGINPGKCALLEDAGVKVLHCQIGGDKHIDIMAALRLLGEQGITRLLVEGGGQVASSLFKANRVERLYWFRAAGVMGGDGLSAVSAFGVDEVSQIARFQHHSYQRLGEDQLEVYEKA